MAQLYVMPVQLFRSMADVTATEVLFHSL